jgi:ATP-binding cassette subfamily B protein
MQAAMTAAETHFLAVDTKPEIADPPNPVKLEWIRGEVEFENVCFEYKTGERSYGMFPSKLQPAKP